MNDTFANSWACGVIAGVPQFGAPISNFDSFSNFNLIGHHLYSNTYPNSVISRAHRISKTANFVPSSSGQEVSWYPYGFVENSIVFKKIESKTAYLQTQQLATLNDVGTYIQKELADAKRLSTQITKYVAGDFGTDATSSEPCIGEYYQLRSRIENTGLELNPQWVKFTEEWLAFDAILATQLLALGAERFALARTAVLKKKLSLVSSAKTILRRVISRIYQFGNTISSQRRWYLYHGAHPSDSFSSVS